MDRSKAMKMATELNALVDMAMKPVAERRAFLEDLVEKKVLEDDGWVAAAINCVRDKDILDIAKEFFIADMIELIEE